jgi:hypothetical protein
MKKLQTLGKVLSRHEQKKILGGDDYSSAPGDYCNVYCGSGSNITCKGTCSNCVDAGNGANPYVAGGDKLCAR